MLGKILTGNHLGREPVLGDNHSPMGKTLPKILVWSSPPKCPSIYTNNLFGQALAKYLKALS